MTASDASLNSAQPHHGEALAPAVGEGLSLHDLIAQHLQQPLSGEASPSVAPVASANKSVGFQTAWVTSQESYADSAYGRANSPATGQRLNATDTNWAAGIEHLLPTPLFRLRVTKERLVRERTDLEQALQKAQQLVRLQPSSSKTEAVSTGQQRVMALRERLLNIKRHEAHVDYQLRQSVPSHQQWLVVGLDFIRQVNDHSRQMSSRVAQWLSVEHWIQRFDPTRKALSQTNQHLQDVERLLSQQFSSDSRHESSLASAGSAIQPDTWVECVTLYDRLTADAEQLQAQLKQRPSWFKHVLSKMLGS